MRVGYSTSSSFEASTHTQVFIKKIQQRTPPQFASEEAAWLFEGETDPAKISARLPQRPAVVVTDGGKELAWSIGKVQGRRAAFNVEVGGWVRSEGYASTPTPIDPHTPDTNHRQAVDTTGAGDAFVAGLLHKLCQDPSMLTDAATGAKGVEERLRAAMAFACGCGALVCQGAGAIDPQPTAVEAAAFVEARGG